MRACRQGIETADAAEDQAILLVHAERGHHHAGVPDAPHQPIDDGKGVETANRPSNIIVPDEDADGGQSTKKS